MPALFFDVQAFFFFFLIYTMPQPIHTGEDLAIYQMVLNRLPFLSDTEKNTSLVSNFTLEVMHELEPCFRVDKNVSETDPTHVGDEQYYSIPQKAVIADVVSCYILILQMLANMAGVADVDSGLTATNNKFLSRTKAGSVEVEWEQFDVQKGSGMLMSPDALLGMYRKSAMRKARALGCIIDVCDDCSTAVELMQDYDVAPFKVVTLTDCGCPSSTPERG